jgi:hypothetical protein
MQTFDYIVQKYNLSIGKRYIIDIPNIGRNDLANVFAELQFNRGAEIGVEKGKYSEVLCKANPNLRLYCVDPWSVAAYEPGIHGIEPQQKSHDEYFEETKERLAPYKCEIIRKTSVAAAEYFLDESLDFVYIDANHDFVNVATDIHIWSKKVKKGGIVSGHDYAFFPLRKHNHVKYVVQSYTRAYGIIPYFVVGAEAFGEPGIVRDAIRSWFWIKT